MDLVRGWTVDQCVYSWEPTQQIILSLPSMGMWVCFSNSSLTFHKNSGSSTWIFSLKVFLLACYREAPESDVGSNCMRPETKLAVKFSLGNILKLQIVLAFPVKWCINMVIGVW